ncbi:potassium transporter [Anaerofilum sp. An201]|nr:cation:proton antiporter [Anaerofilum sp. An201]OUP05445.1 potassium transporter [Anaerofilum sp. An201]
MLTSFALVFLVGLLLGGLARKLHLPALVGMLLTGMLLGPCALHLLDDGILALSADLRQLALIIILTRAGLSLDLGDLRRAGRPAVLLCFLPACFEIAGMVLLAPRLLGVSTLDAAIMGAVVAAVSPAVIVPRMLRLMEAGYGTRKSIPQMILAGASVDDVFVIVLFTAFTGLAQGQSASASSLAGVPVSIALGAAAGFVLGTALAWVWKKLHMRDSAKVLVLLSFSFLLVALENACKGDFPFSGLIAVMSMGAALYRSRPAAAVRLSAKYARLWVAAEVLLFVLVGAAVDLRYAVEAGPLALLLIALVLLFRAAGVLVCVAGTRLCAKERLFCVLAYMPKATVQAAIGGVPLALGLGCGDIVLTVAVLAILFTAPLGALAIDATWKRLLDGPAAPPCNPQRQSV